MLLRPFHIAIALQVGLHSPAEAHDIYSDLKDTWGNSCCNNEDCRPALYRVTPTGVQMFVDGDWIDVPNYVIAYRALAGDTGETGGGHWCGRVYQKVDNSFFHITQCAVLPPSAAASSTLHFSLGNHGIQHVP
jgi:hypothetical protein